MAPGFIENTGCAKNKSPDYHNFENSLFAMISNSHSDFFFFATQIDFVNFVKRR